MPMRVSGSFPRAICSTLASVCFALGCGNLLGLEGLEFDHTLIDPATGGTASDSGTGGLGLGGAILAPLPKEPDLFELWGFPANWPGATIVAAGLPPSSRVPSPTEIASASFHVYEPTTGLLTSHRLAREGREVRVNQWTTDFATLLVRPSPEGLGIYGYKTSGRNELAVPWDPFGDEPTAAAALLSAEENTGSPDWADFHLIHHETGWRLFLYGESSEPDASELVGRYRVIAAERTSETASTFATGEWEPGRSIFLPYDRGHGTHGILRYRPETGAAELFELSEDATELTAVLSNQWAPAWTHLLVFFVDGEPRMLAYDRLSGDTTLAALDETLAFEPIGLKPTLLERNLTSLTLVEFEDKNYALLYNGTTGEARLTDLDNLQNNPIVR